jgi:hypothetical protein
MICVGRRRETEGVRKWLLGKQEEESFATTRTHS